VEEQVLSLYRSGKSLREISRQLGVNFSTVRNIVWRNGELKQSAPRKFDEEKKAKAIELFEQGVSMQAISREIGINNNTISMYLREQGIDTFKHNRKHSLNENVFDIIDTEEKAYWLGFLSADGSVQARTKNGKTVSSYILELGLKADDKHHLEKLCDFLDISREIIKYRKSTNSYRVFVSSTALCKRLIELGLTPNKTYSLKLNENVLNSSLARHYLRGLFDGDGHISKNKYQISITSASLDVLDCVNKHFSEYLQTSYMPYRYRKNSNAIQLRYRVQDSIKILRYLYEDATIFLDRKHELAIAHLSRRRSRDRAVEGENR